MSNEITLSEALSFHKQASAEAQLRDLLVKAAANYILAKESGDREFCKVASADLATVIACQTMVKEAGVMQAIGKGVGAVGKGLKRVGEKMRGPVTRDVLKGGLKKKVGEKLYSAGRKAHAAGARLSGKSLRGMAREGGKAALKAGRKAAPYAAAAGVGAVGAGAAMRGKGKQEKKAGIMQLLGRGVGGASRAIGSLGKKLRGPITDNVLGGGLKKKIGDKLVSMGLKGGQAGASLSGKTLGGLGRSALEATKGAIQANPGTAALLAGGAGLGAGLMGGDAARERLASAAKTGLGGVVPALAAGGGGE